MMLSIKDLVKVYSAKGSSGVCALNSVSIDFPEKGMVFLLGRSGSGKSTLLNVIGGLDKPTSGEIIVKGRSSKDFTMSDFDSYRNTFIGFVFQDYNLLHEFTVEENIAIALRLQNKPNDKEAVDAILQQVELDGLAKRKPNTLSGGQMQRVAIARALIKNPEIIMADEPTGALDSNTGKQILDTLKKLSETRLVIVVSHDRTFAEEYGDRIIELKDGNVIADKSKTETVIGAEDKNVTIVTDELITVKDWKKVTDDEIKQIVSVMRERGGETVITSGKKEMPEVKKALGITDNSKKVGFKKTEKVEKREYGANEAQFIKSKLPMSHAIKMASTGLKHRPIRLVFTILLSVIAFTLFGVLSTLMLYDPAYSVSMAMVNSTYDSVVLEKQYDATESTVLIKSNGDHVVSTVEQTKLRAGFTQDELDKLNNNDLGLNFAGVFDLGYYDYTGLTTGNYRDVTLTLNKIQISNTLYNRYFSNRSLCGFTACGEKYMQDNGFTLIAGSYPVAANEIAVSEYIYELYTQAKPLNIQGETYAFKEPEEMIGRTIYIGTANAALPFKVTGIYDVGEIPAKFKDLYNPYIQLDSKQVAALKAEMEDYIAYSFHTVGFVSEDFYETYKYDQLKLKYDILHGTDLLAGDPIEGMPYPALGDDDRAYTPRSVAQYKHAITILDRQGNAQPFNVTGANIYIPVTSVLKNHMTDYYQKIKAMTGVDANLLSALKTYNTSISATTVEEYMTIYRAMVKDGGEYSYEKVVGRKMELFRERWTLRNCVQQVQTLKVVGVFILPQGKSYEGKILMSDAMRDKYAMPPTSLSIANINEMDSYTSSYVPAAKNDIYGYVLTRTDNAQKQSMFMLEKHANGVNYIMKNDIYELAVEVADIFDELQTWFLVVGSVVGVFAALMLFNFISVGIEDKKNEIGILRAVGARGIDVFKIFIIEALIITTICFILSAVLSGVFCSVLNAVAIETVISISFLNYRFINVLFILLVSLVIAILATIFPVTKAARKSPVESIRAI